MEWNDEPSDPKFQEAKFRKRIFGRVKPVRAKVKCNEIKSAGFYEME